MDSWRYIALILKSTHKLMLAPQTVKILDFCLTLFGMVTVTLSEYYIAQDSVTILIGIDSCINIFSSWKQLGMFEEQWKRIITFDG